MYEYVIDNIVVTQTLTRYELAIEPGEVIARRAADGWRFCQIFERPYMGGSNRYLEVIFERPISGPRDRFTQP